MGNNNSLKQTMQQPQTKELSPVTVMHKNLLSIEAQIAKALPSAGITAERLIRLATTEMSKNPKLATCTKESFLGSVMMAASLGLEVGTLGQAYLIPYGSTCTFIIGWQGLVDLMYRSPLVANISANKIHQFDEFDYEEGANSKLYHKPKCNEFGLPLPESKRGDVIGYYAVAKLTNGSTVHIVMSKEDVQDWGRKFSKTYNNSTSPWKTDFDAMALKTCVRRLAKWVPKATEAHRAASADERVSIYEDGNISTIYDGNAEEGRAEVIVESQLPESDVNGTA